MLSVGQIVNRAYLSRNCDKGQEMKHGKWAVLLTVALVSPPASGRQPVPPSKANTVPVEQVLRSNEAMGEVDSCASAVRPGLTVELCNRTWRGIKWTLYSNWNAQLDTPAGHRWLVHCKYDVIEREDVCYFSTGDQFSIVRRDGYKTIIFWGVEKYPGSPMTARFDDGDPISTTGEAWEHQEALSIYRLMRTGKVMRYRFSNWPDGAARDGRIDLTGFSDTAVLMEAIRDQFTTSRILKKIDVPK